MRGIGAFIGGVLFIAAIFAGWWAIDRVQEHLPDPVNAVIVHGVAEWLVPPTIRSAAAKPVTGSVNVAVA